MKRVVGRFPSSSSDAVHEVTSPDDGGVCWCSCMGWKTSKASPKACTHLRKLVAAGTINAAFVAGGEAVKVESVEKVREQAVVASGPAPRAMLAMGIEGVAKPPWGDERWVAELKIDGWRMFHVVDDEGARQYARSGAQHDLPWLNSLPIPKGTVLDAEWAAGEYDTYASGRTKDTMYVFDALRLGGQDLQCQPWSVRRKAVEMLVESVGHPKLQTSTVVGVPYEEMLDEYVKKGAEGLMLKRRDSCYAPGKRSWDWLKAKGMTTFDVVIVDMEGKSVTPGWKGLRYGVWDGSKVKLVGSVGHTGSPADLEPYIGKVVEVKGYAQSKSGAIRHPHLLRIREDKSPEECTV